MNLNIGDRIMYRQKDMLYEGAIKSIQGDKIEIDDDSVKLIIVASSKNKTADWIIAGDKKTIKQHYGTGGG
jgi:hypothetical protein